MGAAAGAFSPWGVEVGANIEEEQARKYAAIRANDLVRVVGVTLSQETPARSQVVYAILAENTERVLFGLGKAGVGFPVVAIGIDSLTRIGSDFEDPVLAERFAGPISLPGLPPGYVTVDLESSDEDFDQVVVPSLVGAMARREETVSIRALAEDAVPHLCIYPNGYRDRIVARIETAARRAADTNPETFVFGPRTGVNNSAYIRVLASPEDLDPRGRTQRYQALSNRFASGRRRPVVTNPDQLSFFDDARVEGELADLDVVDENDGEEVISGPEQPG